MIDIDMKYLLFKLVSFAIGICVGLFVVKLEEKVKK